MINLFRQYQNMHVHGLSYTKFSTTYSNGTKYQSMDVLYEYQALQGPNSVTACLGSFHSQIVAVSDYPPPPPPGFYSARERPWALRRAFCGDFYGAAGRRLTALTASFTVSPFQRVDCS
jgi:hypothetical protein